MLFDSVNEILDNYRVFGMTGEKYPQRLMYAHSAQITEANLGPLLVKCMEKVMEWNTYMCGFHKDKEDSFLQLPTALDDEIVEQIKDDRMGKLVTREVHDFENKLGEIEEEEYDVLYDVTQLVFEHLMDDLTLFLSGK